MSDRFWAKIWIGGPVRDDLISDFRKELYDAGLLNQDDDDLSDHMEGGVLAFEDAEVPYGCFSNLEDWLVLNQIDFNRQSDGFCEYSPCLVAFRAGIGQTVFILDHDGCHVMRVDDVLHLIAQNPDMGSLILKLRENNGQTLSPLRSFFGTVAPQVIAADELKRRNTDPAAVVCAQCGRQLSDPGLGSSYKHCPTCEP